MNKINIIPIILRHLDTLRDYSSGSRKSSDIGLFYGLPLVVAGIGSCFRWGLTVEALNAVLAAFAIFAGLLLNLLILVYTFSTETEHPNALSKVRSTVTRELHDNIAYSVLLSTIIVVVSLIAIARADTDKFGSTIHAGRYITAVIIFLTANFVLTLLMVLKRIHTMLNERLKPSSVRRAS